MDPWGNSVGRSSQHMIDMFEPRVLPRNPTEFRSSSSGAYGKRTTAGEPLAALNSSKIMELYDLAESSVGVGGVDVGGGGGGVGYDNNRSMLSASARGYGSPARFNLASRGASAGNGRRINDSNYSDLSPMSSNYSADESETMSDQLLKEAAARARRNNNYHAGYGQRGGGGGGGRELDTITTTSTSGYRTMNNARPKSAIIPGSSDVARHMSNLMVAADSVLSDSLHDLDHLNSTKTSPRSRSRSVGKNGMIERYIDSMATPLTYQQQQQQHSNTTTSQGKYGYDSNNYRCDSALSERLQELMLSTADEGSNIQPKSDFHDNQKYINCIKDLVEENETLRRQCSLLLNERNYLQRKLDVACHEFLGNIKMQKAKWYREREMLQTKINGLELMITNLGGVGGGVGGGVVGRGGVAVSSEEYLDDYSDPLHSIGDERALFREMHRAQASL